MVKKRLTSGMIDLHWTSEQWKKVIFNTLTPKWYVCGPLRLGSVIFSDPSSDYAYKVKIYTSQAIGGNVLRVVMVLIDKILSISSALQRRVEACRGVSMSVVERSLGRTMTCRLVLFVSLVALGSCTYFSRPIVPESVRVFPTPRAGEDKDFWYAEAQDELIQSLSRTENNNIAKNVIIFLGDGMSITTVTASRIYKGQQFGQSGEEYKLVWEDFPDAALIKTYDVNKQVPDSASTATAYLCGVKTNYYTSGVDATATLEDCTSITEENKVSSVAQWALTAGKRTGFVTSTRVTHATPSALYAHSASREWECDSMLPVDVGLQCPETKDIARQLFEDYPGVDFNVIMGGGYSCLTGNATDLPGDPLDLEWGCIRSDNFDLFAQWKSNQEAQARKHAAVRTLTELQAVNTSDVDYILGVFANDHVPYEYLKRDLDLDMPTLASMTESAIKVLQNGDSGFVLLVEGGRIDLAHHDGLANIALDETSAFDDAIRTALQLVDTQDTLVVVTSDHSHTATINGYPNRGQDIRGFSSLMDDGLPLSTITYTNGPGFQGSYIADNGGNVERRNLTDDDVTDYDFVKPAGALRYSETHGGDDVALYAIGPMSHLFQRTHEQSYIAHVMGYAACIGPNQSHCDGRHTKK
ncbi:Alkaline phosphatase [Trinorchestia longiramus]|nr:Alkaline phosphatase [Trinorchestia longiramus]